MNLYYKAACCNQDCAIQANGNIYMYTCIVYNVLIGLFMDFWLQDIALTILYYTMLDYIYIHVLHVGLIHYTVPVIALQYQTLPA